MQEERKMACRSLPFFGTFHVFGGTHTNDLVRSSLQSVLYSGHREIDYIGEIHYALRNLEALEEIDVASAYRKSPLSQVINQSDFDNPRIGIKDSGFGDFCFGRAIQEPWNSLIKEDNSKENNLPFVELGGWQRTGVFRFFDLPEPIRKEIFIMICGPFYNDARNHCIEVELTYNEDHSSINGWQTQTFPQYWTAEHPNADLSPEGLDRVQHSERSLYDRQATFMKMHRAHPDRIASYTLTAFPTKKHTNGGGFSNKTDWSMFELVRNLSQVSPEFRCEFGRAFWSRVCLIWESGPNGTNEVGALKALGAFIKERPMACKALRHLVTTISPWKTIKMDGLPGKPKVRLVKALSKVLKMMRLDHVDFLIMLQVPQAVHICKNPTLLEMLRPLRLVNVGKTFKNGFRLEHDNLLYPKREPDILSDFQTMRQKFEEWGMTTRGMDRIRHDILPNNLRPKFGTGAEKYLLLRSLTIEYQQLREKREEKRREEKRKLKEASTAGDVTKCPVYDRCAMDLDGEEKGRGAGEGGSTHEGTAVIEDSPALSDDEDQEFESDEKEVQNIGEGTEWEGFHENADEFHDLLD